MPKNIILCSDGTGNSAAKLYKTNVWRIYRALDLTTKKQVAFYDDGVGTEQFKLLKLLGGALGYGLKRNVIQLYMNLCRTYSKGDKIYLFGFSRGAFTVRTLAGFVRICGLIDPRNFPSEKAFYDAAKENYDKTFRPHFKRGYRRFLDISQKPPTYPGPDIEFIGVWDTVAAYGLPVDELARFWDFVFYPLRFPDQDMLPGVKKGCHAVAIDDERQTFHPVMWNEKGANAGRVEQVWFAGAHSNVGGGYAKDELSYVSLDWMMSKAHQRGLKFLRGEHARVRKLANVSGSANDSRAGFAAYYRYKPRDIEKICNDTYNDVWINTPKIHESVFMRIREKIVPYAPIGIPSRYEIVPLNSDRKTRPSYENKSNAKLRRTALEGAWDVTFWQRLLYVAFFATTIILIWTRFGLEWEADAQCQGLFCVFDPVFKAAIFVVPELIGDWIEVLRQNPWWLAGFLLVFWFLSRLKIRSRSASDNHANAAWAHICDKKAAPPAWNDTRTYRFRSTFGPKWEAFKNWYVAPLIFAVLVFVVLVSLGRIVFEFSATAGSICSQSESSSLATPTTSALKTSFNVDSPCHASGIVLEKGAIYSISINAVPHGANAVEDATIFPWRDGDIAAGPAGLSRISDFAQRLIYLFSTPARRSWSHPWFHLMGRIGHDGNARFGIGSGIARYKAPASGELFLFVNDAVLFSSTWPYRWGLGRNRGTAHVAVKRVEE